MKSRLLDPKQLSPYFTIEDKMILSLIKRRMDLASRVCLYKIRDGGDIYNKEREVERVEFARGLGNDYGLDPNFAAALQYFIIDESTKRQLIQKEGWPKDHPGIQLDPGEPTDAEWYDELKKNLLVLTERWCPSYDSDYERHAFATKAYLEFERTLIEREIGRLANRGTMIDLGCATGRLTYPLSEHFKFAVGYDVSPHMIEVANKKILQHPVGSQVSFTQFDLENGIPICDGIASFVVMSLGTASDIPNIRRVIDETMRVLEPGGRFLFSFYNREALLYRWEFLPWSAGLVAFIDLKRNCLEVLSHDVEHARDELLPVYAHAYTLDEVRELFNGVCADIELSTYPTVSAILPDIVFENQPEAQKVVKGLDAQLSTSSMGAYIIATGLK
ncbi:MAG: methyltransferase domain-containing protein [bacterium]|nr:methyltransferase domain-containing protein [bacterium]